MDEPLCTCPFEDVPQTLKKQCSLDKSDEEAAKDLWNKIIIQPKMLLTVEMIAEIHSIEPKNCGISEIKGFYENVLLKSPFAKGTDYDSVSHRESIVQDYIKTECTAEMVNLRIDLKRYFEVGFKCYKFLLKSAKSADGCKTKELLGILHEVACEIRDQDKNEQAQKLEAAMGTEKMELFRIAEEERVARLEMENKAKKAASLRQEQDKIRLKLVNADFNEVVYITTSDGYEVKNIYKVGSTNAGNLPKTCIPQACNDRIRGLNTGHLVQDGLKLRHYRRCFKARLVEIILKTCYGSLRPDVNREFYELPFPKLKQIVDDIVDFVNIMGLKLNNINVNYIKMLYEQVHETALSINAADYKPAEKLVHNEAILETIDMLKNDEKDEGIIKCVLCKIKKRKVDFHKISKTNSTCKECRKVARRNGTKLGNLMIENKELEKFNQRKCLSCDEVKLRSMFAVEEGVLKMRCIPCYREYKRAKQKKKRNVLSEKRKKKIPKEQIEATKKAADEAVRKAQITNDITLKCFHCGVTKKAEFFDLYRDKDVCKKCRNDMRTTLMNINKRLLVNNQRKCSVCDRIRELKDFPSHGKNKYRSECYDCFREHDNRVKRIYRAREKLAKTLLEQNQKEDDKNAKKDAANQQELEDDEQDEDEQDDDEQDDDEQEENEEENTENTEDESSGEETTDFNED